MTNEERANIANRAALESTEDVYEGVVDLLANIQHLCGRQRISFHEALSVSTTHYDAEVEEERVRHGKR